MRVQVNYAGIVYEAESSGIEADDVEWMYENLHTFDRLKFLSDGGVLILGKEAIQQCAFVFHVDEVDGDGEEEGSKEAGDEEEGQQETGRTKAPTTRPAVSERTTDTKGTRDQ